ncbi:MAG TPA: type IV pilus assembly protein PilM [Methylomirabilota bacterium]|jgi:type IV pilus assembly protein PilM|nr:type IV pilus assembly protein PilM [Methylomirabilota bacterium]
MLSPGNLIKKAISPLFSVLPGAEKSYLSLDIGSSSVKMLEVRGSDEALTIVNAGIAQLPANAIQGNVVQDTESVARTIRTLVAAQKIRASKVIAAVPGPAVIIKRATFPIQPLAELQETIFFEAGNFIPESLENVNLDYQILDSASDSNEVDVLLVAVRKDVINSYVAAIKEAGLTPVVIDVDCFALENMFEANYAPGPDEVVALINIGARYSSINIMKGRRSIFTGDVPVGGRQFTEILSQELGASFEEAEDLKIFGPDDEAKRKEVASVLLSASDQLLDEVQRALSFFWTGSAEEQINVVYLSGGSAHLPGLAEAMGERLQIPVMFSDPFRTFSVSRQIDEQFIQEQASALAVSVGLATRRPGDK